MTAIQPIGDPHDIRLLMRGGIFFDRRENRQPVGKIGYGFESPQPVLRLGRVKRQDLARPLRYRDNGGELRILPGRLDPPRRRGNSLLPARCRRPAIVQNDQQRSGLRLHRQRIQHRSRHREYETSRDDETQQQQPPRCVAGGLAGRTQTENKPQRRKGHQHRARRRDAQQKIQKRQAR